MSAECAHTASSRGIPTGGRARWPPRTRTAYVPASRSPSRLPLGCASEVIRATEPTVSQSSRTPVRARMIAWRARIGPPSSRTIRIPAASLPTERPPVSVSTVAGMITKMVTRVAITSAAPAAGSAEPQDVEHGPEHPGGERGRPGVDHDAFTEQDLVLHGGILPQRPDGHRIAGRPDLTRALEVGPLAVDEDGSQGGADDEHGVDART